METWLLYSLLVILFWGLWGIVGKLAMEHITAKSVFLMGYVGYFSVVLYLVLSGQAHRNLNLAGALWGLLGGALTGWAVYFFFRAIEMGKVAIIVPLTALYPVVTLLLNVVILKEPLSGLQLLGIGLAILAGILVSL